MLGCCTLDSSAPDELSNFVKEALSPKPKPRPNVPGSSRRRQRALTLTGLLGLALAGCITGEPDTSPHAGHEEDPATPTTAQLSPVNRSITGLYPAQQGEDVRLENGSTFNLDARLVTHDPGTGRPIRMMAYNGQLPGPTIRVPQHANVAVDFTNRLEEVTTVHWHGLRLENRFDGVPGQTQDPVPPGESFRYELTFPDAGLFWYHPHVREDLQQELGLYGAILVEPPVRDPAPEVVLLLDDILLNGDDVALAYEEAANSVLMGRYGTAYLTNQQTDWRDAFAPGERVRVQLVNVANARPLNLTFQNAAASLVALDAGRLQTPASITSLVLAPAERATVDLTLPAGGEAKLLNRIGEDGISLATFEVHASRAPAEPLPPAPVEPSEVRSLQDALARKPSMPSATWVLDVDISGNVSNPHEGHAGMTNDSENVGPSPVEWESNAPYAGLTVTTRDVQWTIRNMNAGAGNGTLGTFAAGTLARILLQNPADNEHPMQHPIHLHGQRFLVLSTNDAPNPYPAWKDTVLVPSGSEVEVLVDMSNPGSWMVHCHINEHLEAGMHATFIVR